MRQPRRPLKRLGEKSRTLLQLPVRAAPDRPAPSVVSADSHSAVRRAEGKREMAATNINRVVLTGNLTRDPELRNTPSGTSVCSLRVACNTRRKDASGNWVDKPNYFDVTVWGAQGENCATYLSKGRPVAVDGRLEWREWEAQDGSGKRQAVEIIADSVQFLGSRDDQGAGNGGNGIQASSDVPADTSDFEGEKAGVSSGGGDDDIPF